MKRAINEKKEKLKQPNLDKTTNRYHISSFSRYSYSFINISRDYY